MAFSSERKAAKEKQFKRLEVTLPSVEFHCVGVTLRSAVKQTHLRARLLQALRLRRPSLRRLCVMSPQRVRACMPSLASHSQHEGRRARTYSSLRLAPFSCCCVLFELYLMSVTLAPRLIEGLHSLAKEAHLN